MIDLTLILLPATIAFALSQWWRVPAIPLLIVSGIGLHSVGLSPGPEMLRGVLMLGLAFLVFSAGAELNPVRFRSYLVNSLAVGMLQFVLIGTGAAALGVFLGLGLVPSLYLGLGLAASSTLVVVGILQQRQQFFEPFGRLVLGVLLVQDVLVILGISLLSHYDSGLAGMLLASLKMLLMLALATSLLVWVTPLLLSRFTLDQETLLLLLLAILFVFVGLSQGLGLPLVVGAFLAGFSLSGFPFNGVIQGQLLSLSPFFLTIFFVALGATVSPPDLNELSMVLFFSALIILGTPPLVALLAEKTGLSTRAGIETGLLLAQTSEFSIVLALVGLEQGHISESPLKVLTLVTVLTMALTPFLATDRNTWRLMALHPSRRQPKLHTPPTGHLLLLGCGQTGGLLLGHLKQFRLPLLVVDDDPAVVAGLVASGIQALRGDGADYQLLEAAGARNARLVVSTMRRIKDHTAVLKFVTNGRVVCRVFEEEEAEQIRQRGGKPVVSSHAAVEEFLHWFQERFQVK